MSWLWSILGTFFDSLFGQVSEHIERERGQAGMINAETRAAQMKSTREGMDKERAMVRRVEQAKTAAPTTGAAFNAGALLLMLATSVVLTGCFRFYVHTQPYQPVPPTIERPTVSDEPFNEREQRLVQWGVSTEAALNELRADAIINNLANGYPVSPEQEEWLTRYQERNQ